MRLATPCSTEYWVIPDQELTEKGLLIVTGSNLQAERYDRPLAYRLKGIIERQAEEDGREFNVVVLGDLWFLNSEPLQQLPTISVGSPSINAVAAYLMKRLPNALVVENTLMIQMDLHLEDLRVSLWGTNQNLTNNALDIFINRGYLEQFLDAALARRY